jgi:hypothetical protein
VKHDILEPATSIFMLGCSLQHSTSVAMTRAGPWPEPGDALIANQIAIQIRTPQPSATSLIKSKLKYAFT